MDTNVFISNFLKKNHNQSDEWILEEIKKIPALEDESHPKWEEDMYWEEVIHPYLAFIELATIRKLKAIIPLALERTCYGNPYETMRTLKHNFEKIMNPNWKELGDICLELLDKNQRLGTRLWTINQLVRLDDERARPYFEDAIQLRDKEISWIAQIGLERLDK